MTAICTTEIAASINTISEVIYVIEITILVTNVVNDFRIFIK